MESSMRLLIAAAVAFGLVAQGAYAQTPPPEQAANPQKSFRMYGNTWYAGPHGLGVFLVTASTGDVLIDGGVPGDAELIEGNIHDLGIDLHDIKWILNTHAHSDHAGGLAQLAHDTGAQVIA